MYAFDTTEKAHIGRRSREWTARACLRCLRAHPARRLLKTDEHADVRLFALDYTAQGRGTNAD